MKRIYVILLVALLPSCVALKPDSTKLSAPDYNKRVEVTGAHYDKVLTPIGYSSIVASTLAGGYYGYKSDLIQYYSDTERKSLHAGGALIGAATGFTVSYLLNKAFGWGQVVQVTDPNKWVEKANKNFINLGGETSKFELVHKTAHENWAVRKFKDIDDFTKAFPGSNKTNDVFWSGSQVFERNQLPSLVKLNPTNPYNIKIKYDYP